MRIKKSETYLKLEQKLKESYFLQSILDEIFLIYINYKNKNLLSKKNGNSLIETQLIEMKDKANKQRAILRESIKLQEDFQKKILFLDHENSKIKNKILNTVLK